MDSLGRPRHNSPFLWKSAMVKFQFDIWITIYLSKSCWHKRVNQLLSVHVISEKDFKRLLMLTIEWSEFLVDDFVMSYNRFILKFEANASSNFYQSKRVVTETWPLPIFKLKKCEVATVCGLKNIEENVYRLVHSNDVMWCVSISSNISLVFGSFCAIKVYD